MTCNWKNNTFMNLCWRLINIYENFNDDEKQMNVLILNNQIKQMSVCLSPANVDY